MSHRALLLAGTLLLLVSATAQETPLKGVVWNVPADIGRAEADLAVMRRMGVEAVRTEIILDGRILTQADSLGLVLFQDLPIEWLSATALRDTLDYALELLETAIERSADHPSARNFGLARLSDSSSPRGCEYFARLTERVRRLPRGRTYYVTAFVQDDLCSSEVDMVLIDVSAGSAPLDPFAAMAPPDARRDCRPRHRGSRSVSRVTRSTIPANPRHDIWKHSSVYCRMRPSPQTPYSCTVTVTAGLKPPKGSGSLPQMARPVLPWT